MNNWSALSSDEIESLFIEMIFQDLMARKASGNWKIIVTDPLMRVFLLNCIAFELPKGSKIFGLEVVLDRYTVDYAYKLVPVNSKETRVDQHSIFTSS